MGTALFTVFGVLIVALGATWYVKSNRKSRHAAWSRLAKRSMNRVKGGKTIAFPDKGKYEDPWLRSCAASRRCW